MSESSAGSGDAADESVPADAVEGDQEPEVFANRAARRAKGKGGAKPEVVGKAQRPVGRGSVQSPRQYGNRRSG